jgi:hypothetical protein
MNRQCHFLNVSIAALALMLCASRLSASPVATVIDIVVDEYGNGTITNESTLISVPTPGSLQADPGPGGQSSVLTYSLLAPPSLVAGDVFLTEGPGGPNSDVIRFNPAGTGTTTYAASLLFYSDNADGIDSLADSASPPTSFYTNTATLEEVGTEDNNGAFYTPTSTQPGAVSGFVVNYHFISDLPEPSSVTAIGLCASLALLSRRRKLMKEIDFLAPCIAT